MASGMGEMTCLSENFGVAGVVRLGCMNEATNKTRFDTTNKVKMSRDGTLLEAEMELSVSDCRQLRRPSEDWQFSGSNVGVHGSSFTVAVPSYCGYQVTWYDTSICNNERY